MAITRNEAAAALSDIETTQRRGMTLRGYRIGGPILMMWSAIWGAGYLAMGLLPPQGWALVWLPLDIVGVVGSLLLARRGALRAGGAPANLIGRLLGGMIALMAFGVAVGLILRPADMEGYMALTGLMIGAIYAVIGFWFAPRYVAVGAFMFALTLVGYLAFKPWLAFWMAGGCAGMFLCGLWLWRR